MPITGYTSIQKTIEVLNRALRADPEAITKLFSMRVLVNLELALDETIQVKEGKGEEFTTLSMIGLLNGIFGIDELGWGALRAVWDEDGEILLRFEDNGNRCPLPPSVLEQRPDMASALKDKHGVEVVDLRPTHEGKGFEGAVRFRTNSPKLATALSKEGVKFERGDDDE